MSCSGPRLSSDPLGMEQYRLYFEDGPWAGKYIMSHRPDYYEVVVWSIGPALLQTAHDELPPPITTLVGYRKVGEVRVGEAILNIMAIERGRDRFGNPGDPALN